VSIFAENLTCKEMKTYLMLLMLVEFIQWSSSVFELEDIDRTYCRDDSQCYSNTIDEQWPVSCFLEMKSQNKLDLWGTLF
jgi:hypothetical protein